MAIVVKDRVKETTTTTGQGTVTLLGAVEGFVSFNTIGNGNTTYYTIYNPEDGSFEVGIGTYTATGTTLSRDTVLANSLGTTAKIDFTAGTKDVFCTYPAEKAIYEEPSGNTLIDGGPLTVVGQNVSGYTSFTAVLGELYGNVDSFAQMYAQNYNDGANASGDFVVYRDDALDDTSKFVDMGINSSNYSSLDYPIFTPGSAYLFNDGAELFVGSATDDLVLFAGGVDTTNEAVRIDKTTKAVTTTSDVNVGGDVNATGGTFTAPVTSTSSMTSPGSTEFVTKAYVDNAASVALTVHTAVYLETDDDGNLNATYDNGTAGVGATLTNAGTQDALTIDGVLTTVGMRILVNGQTDETENGVYVVSVVGDGSTNWVLTRSSDADTYGINSPNSLDEGSAFYVEAGLTGAAQTYVCNTPGTITFGTTNITFALFSKVPAYNVVYPLNLTGATLSLDGVVDPTHGGTGVSTVTTGDLLYGSASNTWSKLAAGSAYKSLVMNAGGTNVEWNAVALNQSGAVSGSLGATNGGTGQNAYATGDMLYSDNINSLAKLSGNTSTTKQFLTQTGTGSASQAPAWGTISGSDVTSAVSSATNVAGGAANQIVYQTGSGATGFVTAPVSSGTALTWNGSAFTWASAGGATIADDTATNTSYYPVWANATSGTMATAYVSSTEYTWNPGTATLSLPYSSVYPSFNVGSGTGGIALTINDGYGNCNLAFNHWKGIPDNSGSSGRISCNVDSTTAGMTFQLANSVTAGVAASLTTVASLSTSGLTITGTTTSTAFSGPLTGNVTGNASTASSTPASGITGQTGMWTSSARPGPYRLYRNDDNSAYNVQTTWSADRSGYWSLRGYLNDTYHAACFVAYSGYADTAGNAIGYGQTWQNVTASRANNTTYTNTTGRSIQVLIKHGNSNLLATVYVNGNAFTGIGATGTLGGAMLLSWIVPNGNTYRVDYGYASGQWFELR